MSRTCVTIAEAGRLLGLGDMAIRGLIARGYLDTVPLQSNRVGPRYLAAIPASQVLGAGIGRMFMHFGVETSDVGRMLRVFRQHTDEELEAALAKGQRFIVRDGRQIRAVLATEAEANAISRQGAETVDQIASPALGLIDVQEAWNKLCAWIERQDAQKAEPCKAT